jgi:hypothetical protein
MLTQELNCTLLDYKIKYLNTALAMQIYDATSLCNMEVGFMFIPGIPCLFHIAVKQTDPVYVIGK